MFSFLQILKAIFHSQRQQQPIKPESLEALSTSYTLFESLDELPLWNFIRCLVYQELVHLIKSGIPPVQELAATWARLFGDYLDLNNENETRYLVQLQKEIALDAWQLTVKQDIEMYLLEACTFELKVRLCELIADKGFVLKPKYDTPEEFERDHNRIIGKCSPIDLRHQSKVSEYNKYMESRKGDTIDESYFDGMLIRFLKHFGKLFNARDITVKTFVSLTKEYLKDLDAQKKAMESYGKPQPPF